MDHFMAGLGSLHLLGNERSRSISAENPTGEKGKGGMAIPNPDDPDLPHSFRAVELGQGWKVRPFLNIAAGETVTLMDVKGPGIIQHIWITPSMDFPNTGRSGVLRFYWDGEDEPSVEAPIADLFAVGHEQYAPVNSLAVVVNPSSALNCYWPMPFRKSCRVTYANESTNQDITLTYQINYAETDVPENAGYFHAQWRRAVTDPASPDYTILDGIRGKGRYVGTFLAWTQLSDGWMGEGEVKFFIDGDGKFPTSCGTGTEDYFCASYGFHEPYSTAYVGQTLRHRNGDGPTKWSLYRWHIMDPVCFEQDLRVTIQTLGYIRPDGLWIALSEDIASTAFWYQVEPHAKFPALPSLDKRWPR